MNKKIDPAVIEAIEKLNKFFLSNGFYHRLVMSDDLFALGEIRQRAKEKVHLGDDKFYYGCSLPPSIQGIVDDLVRHHKPALIEIIDTMTDEEREAIGLIVHDDERIKAHLFILSKCGMGFYVSRRSNVPRDQRKPHTPAIDTLKKRMEQNDDYRRSRADRPNRRQYVNLASVTGK